MLRRFNNFNTLLVTAAVATLMLAMPGCGGDDEDTGTDGGTDGETDGGMETFEAGTFQLYTLEVKDSCLDGGLDILFQPDGPSTEYALTNTTEFPGYGDLPTALTVTLQEPFNEMNVTVEADGASGMKIVDGAQIGVKVDAEGYPDCTADMTIGADITLVDNDNLTITANLEVSNWQGECPQIDDDTPPPDPCTVLLTMRGARQ